MFGGGKYITLTPSVLNLWGLGWLGAFPNTKKNIKRQSLNGKVLPDFRDKALMEPFQKKCSHSPCLLVVQTKDGYPVFTFTFQGSGVSIFFDKVSHDHKPTPFHKTVKLTCPFLP